MARFDRHNDIPIELSAVVGTWTGASSPVADADDRTVTIDADGSFFGQSTDGCAWTGAATIPAPGKPLTRIEFEMAGCPTAERNGSYRGLGFVRYPSRGGQNWHLFAAKGNVFFRWFLHR